MLRPHAPVTKACRYTSPPAHVHLFTLAACWCGPFAAHKFPALLAKPAYRPLRPCVRTRGVDVPPLAANHDCVRPRRRLCMAARLQPRA
eukprot:356118-Chlamydomonas_euryale.AAC.13